VGKLNCSSEAEVNCLCATKCVKPSLIISIPLPTFYCFMIPHPSTTSALTSDIPKCLSSSCPELLPSAESLIEQLCAAASPSTSISFSITSLSGSASNSASALPPSNSTSSTPSSGAKPLRYGGVSLAVLAGMGTSTVLGVVFGALLVL
jgi:hypothetical protein